MRDASICVPSSALLSILLLMTKESLIFLFIFSLKRERAGVHAPDDASVHASDDVRDDARDDARDSCDTSEAREEEEKKREVTFEWLFSDAVPFINLQGYIVVFIDLKKIIVVEDCFDYVETDRGFSQSQDAIEMHFDGA